MGDSIAGMEPDVIAILAGGDPATREYRDAYDRAASAAIDGPEGLKFRLDTSAYRPPTYGDGSGAQPPTVEVSPAERGEGDAGAGHRSAAAQGDAPGIPESGRRDDAAPQAAPIRIDTRGRRL